MDSAAGPRAAINLLVADTGTPPIPEAQAWIARYGGAFGPTVNMSQAVPGHPPHPDFMARLVAAAGSLDAAKYGPITGDPGSARDLRFPSVGCLSRYDRPRGRGDHGRLQHGFRGRADAARQGGQQHPPALALVLQP